MCPLRQNAGERLHARQCQLRTFGVVVDHADLPDPPIQPGLVVGPVGIQIGHLHIDRHALARQRRVDIVRDIVAGHIQLPPEGGVGGRTITDILARNPRAIRVLQLHCGLRLI